MMLLRIVIDADFALGNTRNIWTKVAGDDTRRLELTGLDG
jgi:hypothetical protein